tara:strand:+ start:761 stop:1141 length:381 start_codon:yes stop_codon:yes gene_type:complete
MFELYTVVDITETKARKGADKIKENQQQNFLTVLNTIGLRANPTIIKSPEIVKNTFKFGTAYEDVKHVWRFVFDFEYGAHSLDMLKEDFDLVPFINGLTEDTDIIDPVFRTNTSRFCNIIFKELDK